MSAALKDAIASYLREQGLGDGLHTTLVPGLHVFKASQPDTPIHAVYRASLCIVAQGAKRVVFEDQIARYAAGQALVVTVELPAIGEVTEATLEKPYLAVAIEFDMAVLGQVMEQVATPSDARPAISLAAFVVTVAASLADCIVRFVRLLDTPEAIPVLFPGLMRELSYWMLAGQSGEVFQRVVAGSSPTARIVESLRLLSDQSIGTVRIDELASAARMSPSTYHHRFKALTSITPIQYQKKMRLLEARRRLFDQEASVNDVAFSVGYLSASQFSREYSRMFGRSPKRDTGQRSRIIR